MGSVRHLLNGYILAMNDSTFATSINFRLVIVKFIDHLLQTIKITQASFITTFFFEGIMLSMCLQLPVYILNNYLNEIKNFKNVYQLDALTSGSINNLNMQQKKKKTKQFSIYCQKYLKVISTSNLILI